jgi:hypothetical protein
MNIMILKDVLFIIATLCFCVYADPNNSGVITFRDGVQGKVQVVDTSGCTVVIINSNGAKVALQKTRIKTLEWNSNIIDFSSYECIGGDTKPLGMLEPAPKDALATRLRNLPVKKQQKMLGSTVYFLASPLEGVTLESPVDVVAGSMQDLFGKLAKKEVSIGEAINNLLDSNVSDGYFACCYSIREKDKKGHKMVSGFQMMSNGQMIPIGNSISTEDFIIMVRVILVSLKNKCIIFDEECSNTEKVQAAGFFGDSDSKAAYVNARMESIRGAFFEIRYGMAEQGLIEKPGDFEILQRAFKKIADQ